MILPESIALGLGLQHFVVHVSRERAINGIIGRVSGVAVDGLTRMTRRRVFGDSDLVF
jgi:hypothetical protein